MINSRILVQTVTVILVTASAISLSACVAPGVTSQAQHNADVIDYCVKRGTHMECHEMSTAAYAAELELHYERLEMREDDFD